jgi:predicted dithiol-disulfide oxidoreductase (DUF899 family)
MNSTTSTLDHPVVSHSQWLQAHRQLLEKEKELTRQSDELSRERQALPWTRVEKQYTFASPDAAVGLADLFGKCDQLAVYHFMFGPDWQAGCPSCSYVTDHLDAARVHLAARDVALVLVSRAPIDKLAAFQRRMGWQIPWFSSGNSTFNRDFGVSFSPAEVASGEKLYNLGTRTPYSEENPGLSFFRKDHSGGLFHTYSTYARGLDVLLGAYAILDRAPQGRDEAELPSPMSWVRYHDAYEPQTMQIAGSCCHNK